MTRTQVEVTDAMRKAIAGAMAELDPEQIRIWRGMTMAQKAALSLSGSRAALRAAIYRMRLADPGLSELEAQRLVLAFCRAGQKQNMAPDLESDFTAFLF